VYHDSDTLFKYADKKILAPYTETPKSLPTAAVNAIASVPQKQTRMAPRSGEAPPVKAAMPPNVPSNAMAKPGTSHSNEETGASEAVTTGMMAPMVKEAADQKAA
jgi:hypothetical protein